MHKAIMLSQAFPMNNAASPKAPNKIIPCPAYKPLKPARILNVLVSPMIPKCIMIKG